MNTNINVKRILTVIASIVCMLSISFSLTACGKSAGAFAKSGDKNMDQGQYDLACTNFEQALKKNPDRAEYYISYGFALLAKGDIENAIAQFDKAHSNKDNSIVYENNKYAYRGRGIALLKASRYDEAVISLASASAITVKTDVDEDIQKYLALAYMQQGNYEQAIKIYSNMVKKDRTDGAVFAARAQVYAASGDRDNAVADYEAAIKADPKELTYYFKEYEFYENSDDKEEADAVLERAAGVKAEGENGHFKEGILFYIQGDYDKAVTYMGEALKAGINEANYYLGRISAKQGDTEGAKVYYGRYSDAVGGHVTIAGWYDGMADCALKEGDSKNALKYIKEGLSLNDFSLARKFLYREVELYEAQGDYKNALKAAEQYRKLYPDDNEMKKEYIFLNTRVVKK